MDVTKKQIWALRIVRFAIWLLPLFVAVHLFNKNYIPSGDYSIIFFPPQKSDLIRNFASKEPQKVYGGDNQPGAELEYQKITTTPLYFDAFVPRPFKKVTVTMEYFNPDQQPDIKLGVKQPGGGYYLSDMVPENLDVTSFTDTWLTAAASVETPYLYTNNKTVNFIITFPDLPEKNRTILVRKMTLEFQKDPLSVTSLFNKLK